MIEAKSIRYCKFLIVIKTVPWIAESDYQFKYQIYIRDNENF